MARCTKHIGAGLAKPSSSTASSPPVPSTSTAVPTSSGRRFEATFLSTLHGALPVEVELPAPEVTVTLTDEACVFAGRETFVADGAAAIIVVGFRNETERPAANVDGLDAGVDLDRLRADAASVDATSETRGS